MYVGDCQWSRVDTHITGNTHYNMMVYIEDSRTQVEETHTWYQRYCTMN